MSLLVLASCGGSTGGEESGLLVAAGTHELPSPVVDDQPLATATIAPDSSLNTVHASTERLGASRTFHWQVLLTRADSTTGSSNQFLPVGYSGIIDNEHQLAYQRVLLAGGEVLELMATPDANYFRTGESGVWLREARVELPGNLVGPIASLGPANPFATPTPATPHPLSVWSLSSLATSATLIGPKDVRGVAGSLYSMSVPVNEELFTAIGASAPSAEDLAAARDDLGEELLLELVLDASGRALMSILAQDGEGWEFQWWAYDETVEITVPADDEVTGSIEEYYRLHADS